MFVTSSSGFRCRRHPPFWCHTRSPAPPPPPPSNHHHHQCLKLQFTCCLLLFLLHHFPLSGFVCFTPLQSIHTVSSTHLATICLLLLFLHSAVGYITRFTLSVCSLCCCRLSHQDTHERCSSNTHNTPEILKSLPVNHCIGNYF